jgi:hypothetical protein
MKKPKLDAETKLLAALGMFEDLSDAQYWAYYAERARIARDALQFMLRDKWCDGINRHVIEAAVMACASEESHATEEFETARRREEAKA